jgi:hypothetical protein
MNNNKKDTRENLTRQELYCHECGMYVQFTIDQNLDGNHVLECPKCGHEHCRIVKDGVITEDRWQSRNGNSSFTPTYSAIKISYTTASTYTTYSDSTTNITFSTSDLTNSSDSTDSPDSTTGDIFLYQNWLNTIC